MDHNLTAMERENDRQALDGIAREHFIGCEAHDLAKRLTDGRHTTLVDACNGFGPGKVTLADEFVAWCRQTYDDPTEVIAGVLIRNAGWMDATVREWARDYAAFVADGESFGEE